MELDALSEIELVGDVVEPFPLLGQHGDELAGLAVDCDKRLEHLLYQGERRRVDRVLRVEVLGVHVHPHDQCVLGISGGGQGVTPFVRRVE